LNCGKPLYPEAGKYYYSRKKTYCSRRCHYDFLAPVGKRQRWTKGYMLIKVSSETEGTRIKPNWMLEHRYAMQQKLGRMLLPTETVHHKNGIRSDNSDENLELWVGKKHPSGVRVGDPHCPTCRCFEVAGA
jgi:hypothetical protein